MKAFNPGIDYKSDSVGWRVGGGNGGNGVSDESAESAGAMICYKGG